MLMADTFTLSTILTAIGDIVTESVSWVSTTMGVITSNPLILFSTLVGFIGVGIGLIRRFFKLHA